MPRVNSDRAIGIAILAKAPIPGLAKTRLIPHLGAEGAAALQRWLLQRTVATALCADIGPITLWCTPDTQHPDFAQYAEPGQLTLRQQVEGDLGERMYCAVTESPTPAGTLVIGTDCPTLTANHLQQAAAALLTKDAVVTPAEDGGYVLIGLRQAAWQIFSGVEWSSERVMAQTRQRLQSLDWQWLEFLPFWDVDRSNDYDRLIQLFPEVAAAVLQRQDRPKRHDPVRSSPGKPI